MTVPDLPPALLRLTIDRTALAANWHLLDRMSGAAAAGAAIKADAYGLGVAAVVPALLDAGARQFFVAHWCEVAPVLAAGAAPEQIAVLHGVNTPADAAYARATGVRPVINSVRQAALWRAAGGGLCHLMIDTGMNRLGLPPADIGDPAIAALDIDIVLSHLASAEDDTDQSARQLALFAAARSGVSARRASLANSAGIALGSAYHFDVTRPGLALYGGEPCDALAGELAQVAFPQTMVMQIRSVPAGGYVGYNATFRAPHDMRTATVSLGYADGILRCWGEGGALQHAGRPLKILGRVSMDMIVVDCTEAPDLAEGDFCDLPYSLAAAAQTTGLSQYELLTVLGDRFAR
ncbi:alanine racemase [Aurantiacibacter xanthus]|uniref:alanine racemase n=1 Tax=Aurantiacibacter xanthus TaxID=1784712 RepID=A0A3A1PE91_9SPHN|nr:alanine racemase [Aurantiacibacter xanthus]RIV91911.1 alanine racemase [Aurantiacibacter xanthus]